MAIATPISLDWSWPPPNLGVVWLAIYGLTTVYVLYEATKFSHEKKARGPLLSRDPYFMVYDIFPV